MAKMNKKWVALCATAVATVYAAGYFTVPDSQASGQLQPSLSQRGDSSYGNGNSASVTNQLYKDGTYSGLGSNRRGSIQVAVTVKDDKITDVEISDFAMHYSESDVMGLPDEVLQKQSAQLDNVSGATYSTEAFEGAVQDALSQAQIS